MKSKIQDTIYNLRASHILLFKVWGVTSVILALGAALEHFVKFESEAYVMLGALLFIFDLIILPIFFGAFQFYHSFQLGFVYEQKYFIYHFIISFFYLSLFITEIALSFEYPLISIFGEFLVIGVPALLALSFCYVIFFNIK